MTSAMFYFPIDFAVFYVDKNPIDALQGKLNQLPSVSVRLIVKLNFN
jgi:hypothetical protein